MIKAASAYLSAATALFPGLSQESIIHEFQLRGLWPVEVDYGLFAYQSEGFGLPIPVGVGGVTSELVIRPSRPISQEFPLFVLVRIDHPRVNNLEMYVTSPQGTRRKIHYWTGRETNPFEAVYGVNRVSQQSLDFYFGEDIAGTWSLNVVDRIGNTAPGSLREWGLPYPGGAASNVKHWEGLR
jgi:hypothetical protein